MADYFFHRFPDRDEYGLWKFDPTATQTFVRVSHGTLPANDRIISIGDYLLIWGGKQTVDDIAQYPYRLIEFDPNITDPLNGRVVQSGNWPVSKFYGYWHTYSGDPGEQDHIDLYTLGTYVLFFTGAPGRGTFSLYNFDPNFNAPNTSDPLTEARDQVGADAFQSIQAGHELLPMNNYLLDRMPDKTSFRWWSIDVQNNSPLSIPYIDEGIWPEVTAATRITSIGDHLLTWEADGTYQLFTTNPSGDAPFGSCVQSGDLPPEMEGCLTLFGVQKRYAQPSTITPEPGTMDYMRSRIKHVVYYMVESRSFDNVCGWLYGGDRKRGINFIGSDLPFDGTSKTNSNHFKGKDYPVSQFEGGKLSTEYDLNDQTSDPFHGFPDAIVQMYRAGIEGYQKRAKPDMSGFVRNNANPNVMLTLSPEQLPVLNGLAKNFAISDEWFSSTPGGTTMNRAFSVSGSAMNRLGTWEGGNIYKYWDQFPHRSSLWKILYSNGIRDFKIYNAMQWMGFPYTYHLFLQGQVPSIDTFPADYTGSLDQFKRDASAGVLPAFSFLEPIWIAPSGTTSYHPKADLIPAEAALNDLYNTLRQSPQWEETLFVITFSKNGGIYDHVPPPYAKKPWPNDWHDGYAYDVLGPRVPTIFVSPWIKQNTVIRSGTEVPFDSTSFAATLLQWFGIPREKWGLGDRMDQAPTFESVFQRSVPRSKMPTFNNPYDKSFPPQKA